MTTKDIKKATDELLHELQKGEDSAKEKGYIFRILTEKEIFNK